MAFFLFLFSLFNRIGCRIKSALYAKKILEPKRAPLPVISVGSTSLGGSGKTPLSLALVSYFHRTGLRPAFITRGYKGKWEKTGGVLYDGIKSSGSWRESGDEPFMVSKRIPQAGIFVGKNRFESCIKAKKAGFQIAILDDGFQHLRLHRDLDIVLFDRDEKIQLRESLSGIKRAHIILVKKHPNSQIPDEKKPFFSHAEVFGYDVCSEGIFRLEESQPISLEYFKDKKILAFCGIARPERFRSLLEKKDIKLTGFQSFSDHCNYSSSVIKKIQKEIQKTGARAVITTEKDVYKVSDLPLFQQIPLYYLRIELKLNNAFFDLVANSIRERSG